MVTTLSLFSSYSRGSSFSTPTGLLQRLSASQRRGVPSGGREWSGSCRRTSWVYSLRHHCSCIRVSCRGFHRSQIVSRVWFFCRSSCRRGGRPLQSSGTALRGRSRWKRSSTRCFPSSRIRSVDGPRAIVCRLSRGCYWLLPLLGKPSPAVGTRACSAPTWPSTFPCCTCPSFSSGWRCAAGSSTPVAQREGGGGRASFPWGSLSHWPSSACVLGCLRGASRHRFRPLPSAH